ncbi:MAG: alpha/beta hydrolase [Deltaproteobacteria bacterium]|nr:alpha/beta hydrolase [Kofleriaceae bacterium]
MQNRPNGRHWTTRACLFLALTLAGCLDPGDPGNLVPPTVDEDPSLPSIEIADTRLHAEAFGDPDAPLVITLHGGPGVDHRSMLPLQRLADEGYRVVFWDNRGAGLSRRHDASTYGFDGYLEDLRLVVEHYTTRPDQPLVFIGHSWGAMYATWFINEYGDYDGRVKGAILSEPGAFTRAQLDDYMAALEGEISFTGEQLNDALWSRQFMSAADHARADYLASIISFGGLPSEAHDPDNPIPSWRYGAVVGAQLVKLAKESDFDWTTNLSAFPRKVLFLCGDRNTIQTPEHQRRLAAAYPDAEVISMEGGHELQWEHPDEYLAHTRDYFAEIGFAGAEVSP